VTGRLSGAAAATSRHYFMTGRALSMQPAVLRDLTETGVQPAALALAYHPDPAGATPGRLRIGFVMEQVLGHVTWYQNLRQAVTALDEVEARWVETRLFDPHGRLERLPVLPSCMKASARALLDMRRGLRGWPHDVLVFNTHKAAALCQWQMVRTPTILMTDVTPIQYDRMAALYDHQVDGNAAVRAAKHQANVLNFRLAGALVTCSTWARDSFIHDYGVPPERVHVIPIGLDTGYWQPAEPRPAGNRVQLLFVGGHFERKGGRLLLDVFHGLGLSERADLHVVTRDPLQPSPGVIVHHNIQNNSAELLRLYQQADVFVLPTLADCFSNAALEAMAAGLPVVITAMGGIPDIVEHGRTGYLLPAGNGQELAAVLRRLVDDAPLRRALGAAGRQRAVARFDSRTNAARLLALARELHAQRRLPGVASRVV
jgi:glycosyltransferase involved in cell wall biosynthesis